MTTDPYCGCGSKTSFRGESNESSCRIRLCIYSVYETVFIPTVYYNCFTCNLVEDLGCCKVCAERCHKGKRKETPKRERREKERAAKRGERTGEERRGGRLEKRSSDIEVYLTMGIAQAINCRKQCPPRGTIVTVGERIAPNAVPLVV